MSAQAQRPLPHPSQIPTPPDCYLQPPSRLATITAICCLTAAFAAWSGSEAIEGLSITGDDDVPAEVSASMRDAIAFARQSFEGASDEKVLHAMGLYLAQLRHGGYHVEFGEGGGH